MREANKKEILTREIIEKDLKLEYKKRITTNIYIFIGFFIFWCISLTMVEFTFELKNIFCNLISLLLLIGNIVFLCFLIKNICEYKQKNYTIVTEQYIGLVKKLVGNDTHFCMNFDKYGKFILNYMAEYYPSSQYYKMNMQRLIETSTPGDMFYLIVCKNKIIQIYNTKYFEIEN